MRKIVLFAAPLMAAALITTACSSSTGSSSTSAPAESSAASATTESPADPGAEVVAAAMAALEAAMAPVEAPTLEPVTPPSGKKKIGVLVCGEAAPACALMGDADVQAIELLGWEAVRVDGQLSPQGWSDGIMSLVNQKVDAIINMVASDALVKSAVAAAYDAKIPIICQICWNVASPVKNGSSANVDPDMGFQGDIAAAYMISSKKGAPRVALMTNTTAPPVTARMDAIKAQFTACADLGCEIVFEQELGQAGDLVANSRDLTDAILQQFPEGTLDYIVPPSDSQSLGLQQALATAGRTDVKIVSFDAGDPNLEWLRAGEWQELSVATPLVGTSWGSVDQAVRILAGMKGSDVLLPSQAFTSANVPAKGKPAEATDFASAYGAAWGVS